MTEKNFIDFDTTPQPKNAATGDPCVASVVEFCSTWERAVKTVCLYPPTNPRPAEFRQKFFDALSKHLDANGRFVLVTTDKGFTYDGNPACERQNTEDNLAYILFRDGIREIAFEPGVDRDETDRFLTVMAEAFSAAGVAVDVANRLWEAGLSHIRHYTIDRVVNGTYIDAASEAQLESRHRSFVINAKKTPGEADTGDESQLLQGPYGGKQGERFAYVLNVFGDVVGLSQAEQAEIASYAEPEPESAAEQLGLGILFEIIRGTGDALIQNDAINMTERQFEHAVRVDAWDMARWIMAGWQSSPSDISPNLQQRLQSAIISAGDPHHFERLTQYLNANPQMDLTEMKQFLESFGATALKPITAMLSTLEHRAARKMVCDVLATNGREGVDLIGAFVYDKRWYVVRNVAIVLGEIGGERVINYLRKSASHHDKRVRLGTLKALKKITSPDAGRIMLQFLKDSDRDLRLKALKSIGGDHDGHATSELQSLIDQPGLTDNDPEELRELLQAYARAGGAKAAGKLLALAKRSPWFGRRRWLPVRLAAIQALGWCRSGPVAAELGILGRHHNRQIAQAAQQALRFKSVPADQTSVPVQTNGDTREEGDT